jgi:tRNA(fMet)-specific endonuclease VapC
LSGYLLDTNIISALVRAPQGALSQHVARAGQGNVFTSVVVAAELEFGAMKRSSPRLTHSLQAILGAIAVKPFEISAATHYGRLRLGLEQAGLPISGNDMLIAAHALDLDATLVTDNLREFSRVGGLRLENWLR